MGFAKTLKLWAVYKKTSTLQNFIREAIDLYPDTDSARLRDIWYAFETASENATKPEPKPAKAAAYKTVAASKKRVAVVSRPRERLDEIDEPKPKRRASPRKRR
jgi:hypothetical protein